MAEIIAESGGSAGGIYGHFTSKADLVRAVAMGIVSETIVDTESLRQLDPLPSPGELVGLLMRRVMSEIGDPSILVQLWGEAMTDPELLEIARGIVQRIQMAYHAHIALWHQRENGLSESAANAVADAQAPLFIAASQGFIVQRALVDNFDSDAYLSLVAQSLPR